jgi:Gram-negative bacterial TonB protein C-terminal
VGQSENRGASRYWRLRFFGRTDEQGAVSDNTFEELSLPDATCISQQGLRRTYDNVPYVENVCMVPVFPADARSFSPTPSCRIARRNPAGRARSELPALRDDVFRNVLPKYTESACVAHWVGVISVKFSIEEDGTIKNVNLDQDAFGFGESVRGALRDWRFSPAVLDGKPIRSAAIVEFGFGRKGQLSPPTVQFKPAPQSPPPGTAKASNGPLVLSVVVDEHGSPVNIRVAHSLGRGWDEQGIAAIRMWRFKPGLLNNTPIATEVNVAVSFP